MIRIICPKCKKAYLNNQDGVFVCPDCQANFEEKEELLLAGAQYYTEGEYDKANDCLMKYIVQNGADAQAIFYKALCDAVGFDEDTISLNETYDKLLQCLKELPEELFPTYLALANDELEKLEKAVAEAHINLFVEADAEKIKKEVTTIINLQNEAKAFRIKLNAFVNDYNEVAAAKISVRFSECFLVNPELATKIGDLKFEKISDNIASHTVFTGILSTDIKNLEIYYRCIVMFFKKNREKYDFLMTSAEKFNKLSELLEEGQYSSIKGTSTICDKLKSAGYDFFQESLKDHDDDFETQTETVVVLETEVDSVEEDTLEDVSSTSVAEVEDTAEGEAYDVYSDSADAVAAEVTTEAAEAISEDDSEIEAPEDVAEETEEETEDASEAEVEENSFVVELPVEEDEESTEEDEESTDDTAEPSEEAVEKEELDSEPQQEKELPQKTQHKKSYAPFIVLFLVLAGIITLICLAIVPNKLNESNYAEAKQLMAEQKYQEAAEVFAKLENYEDADALTLQAKYLYAKQLEEKEQYEEAKAIYEELDTYEDSLARCSSCIYNVALNTLDSGKYDEAKEIFQSIPEYLDSKEKALECDYQKAYALVNDKKYEEAIAIFTELGDYSDSDKQILDAKYKYVQDNFTKENKTTLEFITDLVEARYPNIAALRKELLGETVADSPASTEGSTLVSTCINYTKGDYTNNLTEADRTKPVYFHVTATDPTLYGKSVTVKFTTSVGYSESKTVVFSESLTTFDRIYPNTDISNYTVEFEVIVGGTVIASQTLTIK